MIVVDVGNTDTVIGIYKKSKLKYVYRFKSKSKKLLSTIKSKINKEIIVRDSKEGEEFEALDNKKYKLKKGMCVITDRSSVLGLGGIIGGTQTSTEFDTKNILLE